MREKTFYTRKLRISKFDERYNYCLSVHEHTYTRVIITMSRVIHGSLRDSPNNFYLVILERSLVPPTMVLNYRSL